MRLPWNLVFTVFDLFESRMLWVKNCHDTISLQCKRKFYHHGIFQISPTEHCDRGFHKKVPKSGPRQNTTSAAKCDMPKDKMQRNATEWCPILSYFALFCHIMLRFVALCQILSLFTQGGPMKPGIWSDFVNKFLTDESFENFWDQWKFALKSVKLLGKFLRSVKIFGKFFRSVNILGKFFRSVKILGQFLRPVRFCWQIFRSVKILIERSDFVDKFLIGGSSIRSVEISFDRSWSAIPRKNFSLYPSHRHRKMGFWKFFFRSPIVWDRV